MEKVVQTESSFDGIGGLRLPAFFECRIAPAGEQFVDIGAQAIDRALSR